jgi:UDP-glucose 4-epimerase
MTTVAVTGASGNVGSAVVDALLAESRVERVVAISRREPEAPPTGGGSDRVVWRPLDVADGGEALAAALTDVDVVIHLAWLIQPSRDESVTWRANVQGTGEVLAASARAGASAVLIASSVGAYSPGPKDRPVTESWPTNGIATSSYSRQKAYVERLIDAFECRHQSMRVVRLRPGLVFQARAASEIRRYFMGPFFPGSVLKPDRLPIFPDISGLTTQIVHAQDLARAFVLAVFSEVRGPFNVAADPPLDTADMAAALGSRPVKLPFAAVRAAAAVSWHLRLQPTDAGWLDLARGVPLMDITRAHEELAWSATRTSPYVFRQLFTGMAQGTGDSTPPLAPDSLVRRLHEVATGIGGH